MLRNRSQCLGVAVVLMAVWGVVTTHAKDSTIPAPSVPRQILRENGSRAIKRSRIVPG